MRRAAASLMLGWLVLLGPWADAQTSLIPPGHVKVTVEFRQEGQRAQRGIDVKGTGPGGTVVQVDPKGVTGSARVQVQESQRIRVKITPQISYQSDRGDGTIALVEASTEVVVHTGQPITIGGTDGRGEVMRQFLLGYERVNQANQVSIVLTAESP
jgi:hypothetical protein